VISMDWAGNISTFSPELLGLKNADYGDFLLGNINRDVLVDLPHRPNFAGMLRDIRTGVEMCRERCEYFSICGGGEPVNKLAENGTFASTETAYCRLTKMRATDLVLDAIEPDAGNRLVDGAAARGRQPIAIMQVLWSTLTPTSTRSSAKNAHHASSISVPFVWNECATLSPAGFSRSIIRNALR